MRRLPYALEPLADLRRSKADQAATELAKAVASKDASERERKAAEQRRQGHDAQAARTRDAEREALEQGQLRAADLARADAWEIQVAAERAALTGAVDRTRAAEDQARTVEARSQVELATREADSSVIDKDRARWDDGQRRLAEAKEEEEAAEAYRPRR
jgi:hypothetical protein